MPNSFLTQLLSEASYAFRPFAVLPLATAIVVLTLGAVVTIRERASRISILFLVLTSTIAIWLLAFSLMYAAWNPAIAQFWGRASFLGIAFIPSAVYHFVVCLARQERRLQATVRAMWVLSAIFALLIQTTDEIVDGVEKYPWGFYPRYAWASGPYLLFFFFGLGAALFHSVQARRVAESDVERQRMTAVSLAMIVGYLACFDYLPSFGIDVLPMGFLAIAGFALIMGYTVWRYELAEITAGLAATRILQTIRGNVLVVDVNGTIRVTSDALSTLLGYTEDELVGKPAALISADLAAEAGSVPDDRQSLYDNRELKWLTRTGQPIDVSVSASAISDRRHRIIGVIYNAEDISRRKSEEARMESELRYRTLVESMNEGVVLVNNTGIVQFVNQRMADMLGFLPSEVLGKPASSFVGETSVDPTHARRTMRLRTLGRRDLWVEVSEAPLLDARDHVIGRIMVHTDITEKRRGEIALRESEARYRVLAEHATDLISRHSPDGRFLYASPAAKTLLGYEPEELIGRRPMELIHPDDASILENASAGLRANLAPATMTFRLRRKDGTYTRVETTWRPVRDHVSNTATELVAISRDITDRIREPSAVNDVLTHRR